MDSYRYGCLSLKGIFPDMMIRRTDLNLFVSSWDIQDKSKIYSPPKVSSPLYVTEENLKALVYYAWNLREDQVVVSPEVTDMIRSVSLKLAKKYGGPGADLPIVYPEDFRKTFCRLVAALAVLDLSSDDDFETIKVTRRHVDFMANFIDTIYSAENCRLNEYSKRYNEEHHLAEADELYVQLKTIKDNQQPGSQKWKMISSMIAEILKLRPDGKDKISQKYFADVHDITRVTVNKYLLPFVKRKLIQSSRGYKPSTKLIRFASFIEREHPDFWDLEEESDDLE